jgi:hypothetical protein
MYNKKRKQFKKKYVLKGWMFFLRTGGCSRSLKVLHGGLNESFSTAKYFLIFGFRKPGTGFAKKPGSSSGFNEYGSSTLSIIA